MVVGQGVMVFGQEFKGTEGRGFLSKSFEKFVKVGEFFRKVGDLLAKTGHLLKKIFTFFAIFESKWDIQLVSK